MSGFEVLPAELDGAAHALRGMGQEAAFLGSGGYGGLGAGGLSGALEGFCSQATTTAAALQQAGSSVGRGLAAGAAGYAAADSAAMPGEG